MQGLEATGPTVAWLSSVVERLRPCGASLRPASLAGPAYASAVGRGIIGMVLARVTAMTNAWYSRFHDVPGVWIPEGPPIDRTELRGYDSRPEIDEYEFDGRKRVSVMWPDGEDGGGSGSPAADWERHTRSGESEAETDRRYLYEQLELPGTTEDYYWALNEGIDSLYQHRRNHPWVLSFVEQLCLATADFVEANPDILGEASNDDGSRYVTPIGVLLDLYVANGFLADALLVVRRARSLNHLPSVLDDIERRAATLLTEEGS